MAGRDLPSGLITFLFTDIEGSTRLSAAAGDEFARLVDRHHHIIREALLANHGVEVSTEGDAFFAVFESPRDAVCATVMAQRDLAAEPWSDGQEIRVRMGLHTGDGRLGGDSYAGYDVNLAARVGAAGHGGQVLLSDATWSRIGPASLDGVAGTVLGEHRLKDIESPVLLHQLVIDGLPSEFPPLHAARPGGLPQSATSLVGRDAEIGAVLELLETSRLVTLTGPGGTGKTRLAIAAARAANTLATAGSWFVPLDGLRDSDLVLPAVAAALEVHEQPGRSLADLMAASIAGRAHLVVMDNFEQVIEAGPAVANLVLAAPGLRLIVTSRLPLRVRGEQEYPVPALTPDAAVELFEARARLVRPDYAVGADRTSVADLAERLDHLPLAIELAAARARVFEPAELLERLDDRLTLLSSTARDAPMRQRTLRAAIEWSVDLLSDAERRALLEWSVFRAGFDLDGAEAVVGLDGPLLVETLVEHSLLAVAGEADGKRRFRMLETIRSFAAGELAEDQASVEHARSAHMRFMLGRAESLEARFSGVDLTVALDAAEREHDDFRAAMDRAIDLGEIELASRIGAALWRFWHQRGHLAEGRVRLEQLSALAGADMAPVAYGRLLRALGGVCFWLGDVDTAFAHYEAAVEVLDTAGDPLERAGALFDLSWSRIARGEAEVARTDLAEALVVFETHADTFQANRARTALISAAIRVDDWEAADAAFGPMISDARRGEAPWVVGERLGLGCIIALHQGRVQEAHDIAVEAADLIIAGGPARWAGWIEGRAALAVGEGQPELAARFVGALQRMRDDGEGILLSSDLLGLDSPGVAARESLGSEYDRHFEAGRALTAEEAWRESLRFD